MRAPYPPEVVENVVADYKQGLSSREISDKYGMSFSTVLNMVKRKGLKVRDSSECKRTYSIDEKYFETISSHSKAQVLGFIYADGCLSKKTEGSGVIQIVLNQKDSDYLEWIREETKNERPIWSSTYTGNDGRTRSAAWFVTCHPKLIRDIQLLGVTEKKSLTIEFPREDQVPKEFLWSFILGVFEGDGCIYLGRCRKGPTIKACVSIAGSVPFNLGLQKFLEESHGIKSDVLIRPTKQNVCISILRINKVADIMRFHSLAYANASFKMERKHAKFSEYRSKYVEIPATNGHGPSYELIERKPFTEENQARLKVLTRANGMKTARSIYIKNPQGQIFHANAVKSFCKEFSLTAKHVYRTVDGVARHHKDWTLPAPEEIATAQAAGSIIEKFY